MSDASSLWLALSEFFGSDNFAELLQKYYEFTTVHHFRASESRTQFS
jgi:hypothetical protein